MLFTLSMNNAELYWEIYFQLQGSALGGEGAVIFTKPAHVAAFFLAPKLLSTILSHATHINEVDDSGSTPLAAACIGALHESDIQQTRYLTNVRDLLLDKGADLTHTSPFAPYFGIADWAVGSGHKIFLEPLLKRPEFSLIRYANGIECTLLHIAVTEGSLEDAMLVASSPAGANINATDSDGRTPLHTAAHNGRLSALEWLLGQGADSSITDIDGRSPLHLAACKGHVDCVRALLSHGACVHARDRYMETPLHYAARSGSVTAFVSILPYILRRGFCPHTSSSMHPACRTSSGSCEAFKDDPTEGIWKIQEFDPDELEPHEEGIIQYSSSGSCQWWMLLTQENGRTIKMPRWAMHPWFWLGTTVLAGLDRIFKLTSRDGFTPVFLAVEKGSPALVDHIIDTDLGLDARSTAGDDDVFDVWNPASISSMQLLLGRRPGLLNASVSLGGRTCFHTAAAGGDVGKLKSFLEACRNDLHRLTVKEFPSTPESKSPLHYAIDNKKTEAAEFILSKGISISLLDDPANPLILAAAKQGAASVLPKLLAAGARLRDHDQLQDGLWKAAMAGSLKTVVLLELYGLDDSLADGREATWTVARDIEGDTSLLKWLKESQPLSFSHVLPMAVFWMARGEPTGAEATAAEVWDMIKQGAESCLNTPAPIGQYPAHASAEAGRPYLLTMFLDAGARSDVLTKDGETLIHSAAMSKSTATLEIALQACRGLMNTARADGRTATHVAASTGDVALLEKLEEVGACLRTTDNQGRTPLHAAAEQLHVESLKFFANRRAPIDATDRSGMTALHICASQDNSEHAVETLIRLGATMVKDANGWTPLDFAQHLATPVITKLTRHAHAQSKAKAPDFVSKLWAHGKALLDERFTGQRTVLGYPAPDQWSKELKANHIALIGENTAFLSGSYPQSFPPLNMLQNVLASSLAGVYMPPGQLSEIWVDQTGEDLNGLAPDAGSTMSVRSTSVTLITNRNSRRFRSTALYLQSS
jgi:ankyrin repeat protein